MFFFPFSSRLVDLSPITLLDTPSLKHTFPDGGVVHHGHLVLNSLNTHRFGAEMYKLRPSQGGIFLYHRALLCGFLLGSSQVF